MFKVIGRFLAEVAFYTDTLPIKIVIVVGITGLILYDTIRYGVEFGKDMWKAVCNSFVQTLKREIYWVKTGKAYELYL